MVFIDGTVVNVALPALQREFGATAAQVQWIVESYALFLASLLLVGGSAGDRFGRRRIFTLGVTLFGSASVWCASVDSIGQLLAARAMQGIGGALLVPGSLALISASFPEDVRGKAIGTWSGWTAITAALGPVIGGILIEHWSWRYAFLLNIPFAAIVLVLSFRFIPAGERNRTAARTDWAGAGLASGGLGALVFGLIETSSSGWNDRHVIGTLLLAVIMLTGFIVVESRHPSPMLPLHLFRSPDFSGANLLTLLLYAALGGSLYFLPLNLIQVQGYSAVAAGSALLPFILTMFALSRWAGGLVDRYGAKRPLVVGPAVASIGFSLLAVPGVGGSYWLTFFPAVLVLGFGMTVCVAPLTTTVMNAFDTDLAGVASGINNAVSRIAAVLSIAVFGVVMSIAFRHAFAKAVAEMQVTPSVVQQAMAQENRLAAIELPETTAAAEKEAIRAAVANSFVHGFRWVMLLSACLALASSISAWLLIGRNTAQANGPR
ncbi:MFS transporter [Noviherbaspirillum denitrificans]|nr:MFS transporter [Noviherbaspirillum denitrificans]